MLFYHWKIKESDPEQHLMCLETIHDNSEQSEPLSLRIK